MTEADARRWVAERFPDAVDTVTRFLDLVIDENRRQNLVAPSTVDNIWMRHAVDSLQLIDYADADGKWVDIGSGAGFPGLVVAIARVRPTILIEPRRKRANFLRHAANFLALHHVEVIQAYANTVDVAAAVISARAVAGVDRLVAWGNHWASPTTRWIMPRGTISEDDMALLGRTFGSMFHVEHSITAPGSHIVLALGRSR